MNKSPEILRGTLAVISPEILRQVSDPTGICHFCESHEVYALREVDPDTLKTVDTIYWCLGCDAKWGFYLNIPEGL